MAFERIATILYNVTAGAALVLAVAESSPAWAALCLVSAASQFYPDVVLGEIMAEAGSEPDEPKKED